MNEPISDETLALAPETVLKRDMPLIPSGSIAGNALVVVIAIMTFLACLTAGGALLVARASEQWRSEVLRDITIQLMPRPGDDLDSLVAKAVSAASQAPGVDRVHAYSATEFGKTLGALARHGTRPEPAAYTQIDRGPHAGPVRR